MLTDWTEYPFDYESYLVDTNAESYLFLRAAYTYCSNDVLLLPVTRYFSLYASYFEVTRLFLCLLVQNISR